MGTGEDAIGIIQDINSEVYVIPGNCDPRDMPRKISDVAHDMHGKSTEIDGIHFAGLGGSNITIFGTPFELTENELYQGLKQISKKGMVLMTHVPPYGILDQIPSGQSVGSKAVKRIVDEFEPILALSGHVHEARGIVEQDGTVFVNPGPARGRLRRISGYQRTVKPEALFCWASRGCNLYHKPFYTYLM
ncbi:MAG: metallophosphoesterase [Candidatus Methanomethylophilaceae archaeon]